ncbi:MobF family relaxase [Streptomyces sp. NPDC020379]|uniref:MobF family relaxase n=1 Tax=Streptomyces sp. NPDC020379 TaxID=3365071 RepID=UPI0037AFAEE7
MSVGWATGIYAPEQVEYRLAEGCGCDVAADAQVEYRLAAERDLRWIGSGLAELGLVAGGTVDPDAARALMDGRDWRTGEQLVKRKKALDPRGKLTARVLVDAVNEVAAADGKSAAEYLGNDRLAKRFARAERGIVRDGEQHLLPVADVERLASAAGLDADALYGAGVVEKARRWQHHHVDVGLRGVDIVLDLPKSISAAYALANEELSEAVEAAWMASVGEAVESLEEWTAYGMAGHHGDGQRAERISTSGLLGWTTLHRSARPVKGAVADPHLHVHVNIAHMARCADGKWRTIAAGAEDLHRHARVINEIAEARLRARLIDKHGARFERSTETGAWELVGIHDEVRTAFSQRHQQIIEHVGEGASRDQQKAAARATAEAKNEDEAAPRENWRTRAAAVLGGEAAVDAMVSAALPGPDDGPALSVASGGGPRMPSPHEIAVQIWDAEHGLTASKKAVSRTHVLAAAAAAVPYLTSREQLVELTDAVLAEDGHAVRLADSDRHHQSNRQRYTHTSVVEAEQTIIDCATAGLDAGLAQLTTAAAELAVSTSEAAQGFAFSSEQRAVVMRLLTAGHGADAVIGVAGAGKTTLMNAARTGWEAAGLRVVGASTAAVAAANLAAEAGIESQTIAAWTREISGGKGLHGVGAFVIDEAAMVDDRALAVLLRHAAETGTKVAGVGDPMQLRAVGIGGGFARIHELVDGLVLTENRRQRDVVERAALQTWRDGARTSALSQLAEHGHVHAAQTSTEALTAMLDAWTQARTWWQGDPHGQVANLLLLAARRADVATLNAGARAALVASGELAQGRPFAVTGGARIHFAPGDLVHIRRNDYRSRRDPNAVDVLNGYRGIVLDVRQDQGVLVEWRRPTPDGPVLQSAWMSPGDIAEGRLSHGYAMTIGSAQGLTADMALAYGLHADAHSLYPALSRARIESHLFLPLHDLEDHPTRARLGTPRTERERLDRAVAAYGRLLERDGDDVMVTDELAHARAEHFGAETPEQEAVRRSTRAFPAGEARIIPPQLQAHREAQEQAEQQRTDGAAPTPAVADGSEGHHTTPPDTHARVNELLAIGYASRPEQAPEPEAEPVTPWTERPHGHVATANLERYAEAADEKAQDAAAKASRFEQRAADLAAVLGTDESPARIQYGDLVGKAELAADQLRRADKADQEAARIDKRISAMYATNREEIGQESSKRAQAKLKRSAVTFQRGRLEKEADTLRDQITERTEEIAVLREQMNKLRGDANTLRTQARDALRELSGNAPINVHRLGEHLKEQQAALPARLVRLERADVDQHAYLTKTAQAHRRTQDKETNKAAGLREEATLRAGLSPEQMAEEIKERTAAARRAAAEHRAQQQAAREAAERSAAAYDPDRYSGPSRGGGLGL